MSGDSGFNISLVLNAPTAEAAERVNSAAICRESYWIGLDRQALSAKMAERAKVLRPAYGSQPLFTQSSKVEQTFMDRKGRGW
jgi:hypothetical protein